MVGLNLLRLLVQNRIAEFHTDLEVLDPQVPTHPLSPIPSPQTLNSAPVHGTFLLPSNWVVLPFTILCKVDQLCESLSTNTLYMGHGKLCFKGCHSIAHTRRTTSVARIWLCQPHGSCCDNSPPACHGRLPAKAACEWRKWCAGSAE